MLATATNYPLLLLLSMIGLFLSIAAIAIKVTCTDGRHQEANGLFLAGFFDFT
jgi:hypothetical protein